MDPVTQPMCKLVGISETLRKRYYIKDFTADCGNGCTFTFVSDYRCSDCFRVDCKRSDHCGSGLSATSRSVGRFLLTLKTDKCFIFILQLLDFRPVPATLLKLMSTFEAYVETFHGMSHNLFFQAMEEEDGTTELS